MSRIVAASCFFPDIDILRFSAACSIFEIQLMTIKTGFYFPFSELPLVLFDCQFEDCNWLCDSGNSVNINNLLFSH